MDGRVTEFATPRPNSGPRAIVPGPDGNSLTQNVAGLLVQYAFTPAVADQLMLAWFKTN